MRIIPVLDLMGGVVVRGVGGERANYRPIVSRLVSSPGPLEVARAFRLHFGFQELYLADLDALAGQPPSGWIFSALLREGFGLWVDAGIQTAADAEPLARAGVQGIVAGLETLAGPEVLEQLCREHGGKIVFSLDLKNGLPLGKTESWKTALPVELARQAIARGAGRLLVLDLRRVGSSQGTGTEDLCRRLRAEYPDLELASGGGVSSLADLERLQEIGLQAVLVASVLHDGRLLPADVANLLGPSEHLQRGPA